MQVVDASISESMFNMLEGCIPELVHHGHNRPPSGSTISGGAARSAFTLTRPSLAGHVGCCSNTSVWSTVVWYFCRLCLLPCWASSRAACH